MCLLTLWLLLLSQDLVDILNGGVSLDTLGGLAGLDPNALIGNVTEDTIAGTSVKAAEDFFCLCSPSQSRPISHPSLVVFFPRLSDWHWR